MENRISQFLENGIIIGDRTFEFLAYSSSQLREHSCWFVDTQIGGINVRNWMGNFDKIKTVGKYAARLGQAFSSSQRGPVVQYVEIPEVMSNFPKIPFSDGIGTMSIKFCAELVQRLQLEHIPSAFQIRIGGVKGVISVDPKSSDEISVRPSMIKYSSPDKNLDILGWSKPLPAFLNRQAISILSTLGISDEIFMEKLQRFVDEVKKCMKDAKIAAKLLTKFSNNFHSFTETILKMIRCGIFVEDEFVSQYIQCFIARMVNGCKDKARIPIEQGRVLMGVLDESKTLKPNQVFIQVENEKENRCQVIQGPVVIIKSPCFHPGDVRIYEAVRNDYLETHMKNCLVFSQLGHRPVPNMLSGSDLDGDLYFVSWDVDLLSFENQTPMDFSGSDAEEVESVQVESVIKFFVNYVKNDNLGQIANAHLAFSDASPKGVFDPQCLRLAQLHSVAVDFPKTGVPAVFRIDDRPKSYPDFMNKTKKVTYVSKKVLGEMYRNVEAMKITKSEDLHRNSKIWEHGWEDHVDQAVRDRDEYNFHLTSIMNKFGIKNEVEALSGNLLKKKTRYHELRNMLFMELQVLRADFEIEAEDPKIRREIAVARYQACYHPSFREPYSDHRMLSFAWLAVDDLLECVK
eukprot:TRINITY_DN7601_c0_g1_i2.p1 TRINITY_DN7601_c0_g1~~TRINITY_DN7601_c0_g1_i2.p1  ORF type:complete len:678 (-),score=208.64 TRINITY_DN7601_c0_g1_i2:58-1947(-)